MAGVVRWSSALAALMALGCLQESAAPVKQPAASVPTVTAKVDVGDAGEIPAPAKKPDSAAKDAVQGPATNDAAQVAAVKPPPAAEPAAEPPAQPEPAPPEASGLKRLVPDYDVWIDPMKKQVVMTGEIVRQEGQLEMFACLKGTKEHESVVAVNTKAYVVNAALIALGAAPGKPVIFRPEFKPAHGPEVDVFVIWSAADGKRKQAKAQEWVRQIKTGKELDKPWVFGGSGFWKDENTGTEHFMAEDGDFICLSNFTSAMLDLPVASSAETSELGFEAFTERIPPVKSRVVLVLAPKISVKTIEKPAIEQ